MAKKKYYVVWEGNETGVFDSWDQCKLQIQGYPNAKYKSFKSKAEADDAFYGKPEDYYKKKAAKPSPELLKEHPIEWNSMSVDAACSGNPGLMEYQGVDTQTGYVFFHQGPFARGTNNVGEFLALVHALALLKKEGKNDLPIYSDSKIAISWVRQKTVKTKLSRTSQNGILFEMMERAVSWLEKNEFSNPILKWETKEWGEIPADFGRK